MVIKRDNSREMQRETEINTDRKRETNGERPGPNVIKKLSVNYGFRNKLECLSLVSFSSLV